MSQEAVSCLHMLPNVTDTCHIKSFGTSSHRVGPGSHQWCPHDRSSSIPLSHDREWPEGAPSQNHVAGRCGENMQEHFTQCTKDQKGVVAGK